MSNKDNGGNAFPIPGLHEDESFNGMTLRDYFAAKAMHALVASLSPADQHNLEAGVMGFAIKSHAAYVIADHMITERAK